MSYEEVAVFAVDYLLALNKKTHFISFDAIEKAVAVASALYLETVTAGLDDVLRNDLNRIFATVGQALIGEKREKTRAPYSRRAVTKNVPFFRKQSRFVCRIGCANRSETSRKTSPVQKGKPMQVAFVSGSNPRTAPEEIAADPTTPASVLQELYESHQQHYDRKTYKWVAETPEVMAALAQNPNTPLALLSALLPGYAPTFCQNPVAPFVLLEAPDFLSNVGAKAQQSLLFCAQAPAALVRVLAAQTGASGRVGKEDAAIIADAARHHVALAGECAPDRWQGELETICRAVCENPPTHDAREFHADYAELGLLPSSWPEAVSPLPTVKNTKLSKELNGHPWRDKAGSVLVKALAPNLAPELLQAMANESDHTLSQALVLYGETPADVLQTVASAEFAEMRLRLYAAKHRNAGQALLAEFASDGNPFLRRLARQHKNAPEGVRALGRQTAIQKRGATPLWLLVSGLYGKLTLEEIRKRAEAPVWMERLSSVFALTNGATRVSDERRALLREHATDANRFVRAAAQAFLENPDYRFSW